MPRKFDTYFFFLLFNMIYRDFCLVIASSSILNFSNYCTSLLTVAGWQFFCASIALFRCIRMLIQMQYKVFTIFINLQHKMWKPFTVMKLWSLLNRS